jgi:hypothetical protein
MYKLQEMFSTADSVQDDFDHEEYKLHNTVPFTISHADQRNKTDDKLKNSKYNKEVIGIIQLLIKICNILIQKRL